jgi:hypothetical protein
MNNRITVTASPVSPMPSAPAHATAINKSIVMRRANISARRPFKNTGAPAINTAAPNNRDSGSSPEKGPMLIGSRPRSVNAPTTTTAVTISARRSVGCSHRNLTNPMKPRRSMTSVATGSFAAIR